MLCLVKGPVGALHHVVPRLFGDFVVRRTEPAADSQNLQWVRLVGNTAVCNPLDKSSCHGVSVVSRSFRQQHEYFFPAIPVDAIRFPNGLFEKAADLLQHSVVRRIAIVIVVELEIVDVEKDNRIRTLIASGRGVGMMEIHFHGTVVSDPEQTVFQGEVAKFLVRLQQLLRASGDLALENLRILVYDLEMRGDKISVGDDSDEMALTVGDREVANPVGLGRLPKLRIKWHFLAG
jgi:hypothetical protein